ncbi:hypothetical protein E3N88_43784 [Mikania micrantha]|uniref:Integrase catalytic domain-containing protein n=1 Tax=Mikania micrantha TaxID=192012 RepID=A0A5N6LE31_9ASTR|nr:hypothetical protein E3N88_43784 [Mikania micrantha]
MPSAFTCFLGQPHTSKRPRRLLLVYPHSPNQQLHQQHLQTALHLLQEQSFYVKVTKCYFGQSQVPFMGHVITADGVQVKQDKIPAIVSWHIPVNVNVVCGFLGLTGYYRRFVRNDGILARPLTSLTKKEGFHWNKEALAAFETLKQALIFAPVLSLTDFNIPFIVECDASSEGLMPYDFSIIYHSGKENRGADALSRRPLHATLVVPYSYEIADIYAGLLVGPYTNQIIVALKQDPNYVPGYALIDQALLFKGKLVVQDYLGLRDRILQEAHAIHEDLSMDFIVGLPPSNRVDTILVVVDRLSIYAHFMPLTHPFTAKTVVAVFCKEIVCLHGIPRSIVIDRDVIFLSHFWQEMFRLSQTKLKMSAGYHPQTDGQTKVLNRCLEAYLRSTKTTPSTIVYGQPLPTFHPYVLGETKNTDLERQLIDRDEMLTLLKIIVLKAQNRMRAQADSKRSEEKEKKPIVDLQLGLLLQEEEAQHIRVPASSWISYAFRHPPCPSLSHMSPMAWRDVGEGAAREPEKEAEPLKCRRRRQPGVNERRRDSRERLRGRLRGRRTADAGVSTDRFYGLRSPLFWLRDRRDAVGKQE